MSDHADSAGESTFTPEEQAAWDAYESGADAPAPAAGEPAGTPEPAAAGVATPEAAAPAGEPAAAPGDVVDPDDAGADDAEANKGRFVRHGAFHRERMLRKEREAELATLREQFTRGDERLKLLMQAAQAAPKPDAAAPAAAAEPEKVPDPNEDIFGYAKYLEKKIEDLASGQQKVTEAQQQAADAARASAEEQQVISTYQQDIARVMRTDASFGDAYRFLVNGRVEELKLYGLDHNAAVQQANADELALVRSAMGRGESPAELMGRLAKSRGFVAKAPEPAAPPAPVETAAQKAERNAAGANGPGRSLSAAGGGPAGEVTIEMLASMSEGDFEKFANNNPAKLAALMGAA